MTELTRRGFLKTAGAVAAVAAAAPLLPAVAEEEIVAQGIIAGVAADCVSRTLYEHALAESFRQMKEIYAANILSQGTAFNG